MMANIGTPPISSHVGDITDANTTTNVGGTMPLERRCDNPDCTVSKMVSKVPKRKASQFVKDPFVMEKPLLVSGFTTIFQIEGQSAKLSDLKSLDAQKPLYRIVPNTHAHIVNYVVVDSDAESLRKINENDPATMRKLLSSQKQSADQMLKKLIAGHPAPLCNVNSIPASTPTGTIAPNIPTNVGSITPISVAKLMPQQPTPPPLQLPTRVHPNLQITAVASADGLTKIAPSGVNNLMNAPTTNVVLAGTTPVQQLPLQLPVQSTPTVPLITPVPLANLQRAPITTAVPMATHTLVVPSNIGISPLVHSTAPTTVEKPVFDQMQQELQELRRTVALLAEAQAKTIQT